MSDDTTVELDSRVLEKFIRMLKKPIPVVKIGILGNSTRSDSGGVTNAEVGAAHEFGAPARGLPQRSFLRVPLYDELNKKLEQSGAFDKETFEEVASEGSFLPWMKKVGVVAEAIVLEGFSTQGYGKWAPWKNPNYHNEGGLILTDSGQLRNSITHEVTG